MNESLGGKEQRNGDRALTISRKVSALSRHFLRNFRRNPHIPVFTLHLYARVNL